MNQPDGGEEMARARARMVESQLRSREIRDPRVLAAMGSVPREVFVPADQRARAYDDCPLSIGRGQTISQPFVVALMSELLRLEGHERVLEIGTGCGYQTAVLAELAAEVLTIEIDEVLQHEAAERLRRLGYRNLRLRCGDGYEGWSEEAPFPAILVAAAPSAVPPPLVEQLAPGGRLVIPVGDDRQDLLRVVREDGGFVAEEVLPVRFVRFRREE